MSPPKTPDVKFSDSPPPSSWVEKSGSLMAWAVRADSWRAVHVSMLLHEETGLKCGCVCPACGAILQAVNAGKDDAHFKQPNTLRAFFRHHTGQQQDECLKRAAKLAALQLLIESQQIDLPGYTVHRSVAGVSGAVYSSQAHRASLKLEIVERRWVDEQTASITLANGRVVLLSLVADTQVSSVDGYDAVISINVNDPEVSTWSPEKILASMSLDGAWLCWRKHWDEEALQLEAAEAARKQAHEMIDALPAGLVLADSATALQRSESVLHWVIKNLVAGLTSIEVAGHSEVVGLDFPDGSYRQLPISLPPMTLLLANARLEHALGGVVPDVMCRARQMGGRAEPFELLVEVAVTNPVGSLKRLKLESMDLACIEIDVGLIGRSGRVSVEELRSILEAHGSIKRWIHHPRLVQLRARANAELLQQFEVAKEEALIEARRDDQFRAWTTWQRLRAYVTLLRAQWGNQAPKVFDDVRWRVSDLARRLTGDPELGVMLDPLLAARVVCYGSSTEFVRLGPRVTHFRRQGCFTTL